MHSEKPKRPSARAAFTPTHPPLPELHEFLAHGWTKVARAAGPTWIYPIGHFSVELTEAHPTDGDRLVRFRCGSTVLYLQVLAPCSTLRIAKTRALGEVKEWLRGTFGGVLP